MNQDLGLGQVFAKDEKFTIYSMGTENTGMYFACIPNELKSSLKVFVDLHKKDDFNMYRDINDPTRRKELIEKLNEVNTFINRMNESGVYVMPVIDVAAVENLNDQSKSEEFNRVFKMIAGCTKDVSEKLNSASNGQKTIEQAITIIEQTESDKQFISWLKQQFPTFVMGITLDDLRKQYQAEQQMVNSTVVPENVNMNAIDNNVISNTASPVQSNVNISNDSIISMAQNNVQTGNSVEELQKKDDIINQIENGPVQNLNQQVSENFVQQPVPISPEPLQQAPIVNINSNGITPIDHSLDEIAYQ